jgi:hypothetical protein
MSSDTLAVEEGSKASAKVSFTRYQTDSDHAFAWVIPLLTSIRSFVGGRHGQSMGEWSAIAKSHDE